MAKYIVEIVYETPFIFEDIEAKSEEAAVMEALGLAREEYENDNTCFDVNRVIKSVEKSN